MKTLLIVIEWILSNVYFFQSENDKEGAQKYAKHFTLLKVANKYLLQSTIILNN